MEPMSCRAHLHLWMGNGRNLVSRFSYAVWCGVIEIFHTSMKIAPLCFSTNVLDRAEVIMFGIF